MVTRPVDGWQTVDIRSNRHDAVTPPRARATRVEALDQVRLVGRGREVAASPARMREGSDEQVRVDAPAPICWLVREIDAVPLGFTTRRVGDDGVGPGHFHIFLTCQHGKAGLLRTKTLVRCGNHQRRRRPGPPFTAEPHGTYEKFR